MSRAAKTVCRTGPTCRLHGKYCVLPQKGSVRRGLDRKEDIVYINKIVDDSIDFWSSLTDDEQNVVDWYRFVGYGAVNEILWGKENVHPDEFFQKQSNVLEKALTKVTPSANPRILYRSFKLGPKNEWDKTSIEKYVSDNFVVGQEHVFEAFTSTSVDPTLMVHNLRKTSNAAIVFEIRTNKGAPLNKERGFDSNNFQASEYEVLLQKGSRFKIVGVHPATYEAQVVTNMWSKVRETRRVRPYVVQLEETE